MAFTYCFFCSGYLLLAIVSRGILLSIYMTHTGYRAHQNISSTDGLMFVAVIAYSFFYIYSCLREPQYYEEIE